MVMECITKLKRITMNNQISLSWISGLKRIKANEHADLLAKEAASTKQIRLKSFSAVAHSTYYGKSKVHAEIVIGSKCLDFAM